MKLSRSPEDEAEEADVTNVWLVTYSDMVTLLLAFFLLIFSFTVMGEQESGALVDSLNEVVEGGKKHAEQAQAAEELEATAREIASRFAGEEKAFVDATEREVAIVLPSGVTFALGDATLTGAAREQLAEVAEGLGKLPNAIRIEGHTDDIPVRGGRYGSNWNLSAARAQSVLQVFLEKGLEPRRLEVVGYGAARPRQSNDSEEGRRANRRIEIKLVRGGS